MASVLITGGAGFIGSRLAMSLFSDGHRVKVLDSFSEQVHGSVDGTERQFEDLLSVAQVQKGDINNRLDLEQALTGIDTVVHLAAETGTGQSMYEIDRYSRVNIGGTALLLDLIVNGPYDVRKVVVASSRSVYGEGKYATKAGAVVYPSHRLESQLLKGDFEVRLPDSDDPLVLLPTDEESALHPSSVYGITKLTQEQLVMTVCASHGLAAVALRYQNVYGPGQSLTNPYTGILSIFTSLIRSGGEINIFEDGLESRDFVFVDDVVGATSLAATDARADGQILNVGSGVATSVLDVIDALFTASGREVATRVSGNFRLGDIRHNFADLTRLRTVLGFEPATNFADGIAKFVSWTENQTPGGDYASSLREMRDRNLLK